MAHLKRILSIGLAASMLWLRSVPSWAAGDDAFQFFQEEAKVISASRIPEYRQRAPATTYVVTSEDLRATGAQNIWDALRNVPGVDVMQTTTGQGEVSIRGLNHPLNNRTLILLDGKTVLNGFFDFVTWESIPVTIDEIDRIEIVEGPASAVYGANAVNGVINILTKRPEQLQGGKLSYTTGNHSTQLGSFVYGRQQEKLGYRLGGGWHSMDEFGNSEEFASQAGKFDSLLSYKFSPDADMSVSGGVTNLNTEITTGAAGKAFDRGIISFARADYRYVDTRVKTFWNHGRTNLNEFQYPPNVNLDYDTYDAEVNQSVSLPLRNQAVFGASYRRNTARSAAFAPGLLQQDLWSGFVEDKWSMTDRWTLVASGRVDSHPYTPLEFSPRGSLIYSPVVEQVFRLSGGSAFRNPTLLDNNIDITLPFPNPGTNIPNPPYTTIQSRTIGNRTLDPEKVKSVEVAHNGDFGRIKTTLVAFHYQLADTIGSSDPAIISVTPPTFATQSSFANESGILRAWGGEAGVNLVFTSWLTAFGNYSYQYLHDDSANQSTSNQSPRHKANAGVTARNGGWTGNLWTNWVDKTVWATVLGNAGPNDLAAVSSYFLMNAHAGYQFAGSWNGFEIGVTAFNLLNHRHYEILPAQSAALPGQNGDIVGSRWTGTVSYRF